MSSRHNLLVLLALSGCGFSPLYGQSGASAVADKLDMVAVQNIPERTGQILRLTLETQLHAAGAPAQQLYSLAVNYSINTTAIGQQADSSSTRNRFAAAAKWTLTPIGSPGKTLIGGTAVASDAQNIIDQQYFAQTVEVDTINQEIANEVAAQITAQIAAYFKAHPTA